MSAFGENLRREREMRGVSLAEISAATKIGARMLDAVETERFERLPGGVFNAAFVRQYARYLGLDEDRVVAEFNAASGSSIVKSTQERDASLAALRQMVASEAASDGTRGLPLIIALGLLLLGGAGFGGWQWWHKHHPDVKVIAPAPQPVVIPAPPTPAPVATPAKPLVTGLDIDMESKDRCTLQISIDGRASWNLRMGRGSHRNLKADHTVQLTVDNAAALKITRNGEVMPALGGKNETQTVTYRADQE